MLRSSLPGSIPDRARRDDVNTAGGGGQWSRQPVLWLGALILVMSLLGCIATIVLAWRHADLPIETTGSSVMRVPSGHQPDVRPAERGVR